MNHRQARIDGKAMHTIWLQERRLPPWSVTLDLAATRDFVLDAADAVTGGHERLAVFWWRFTICRGRLRKAGSDLVFLNAVRLRDELFHNQGSALSRLTSWSCDESANVIFNDWMESLSTICEEVGKANELVWYGGYDGVGPFEIDNPSVAPPWPETEFASKSRNTKS